MATLRYQFPYLEAGGRRPDPRPRLLQAVRVAVAAGAEHAAGLPLLAGGKSMGGRMTSLAAAEAPLAGVRGLVFAGFPLHPAGRPGSERAAHLAEVALPMLFLQGTRDRLAELPLLEPICAGLGARATLHVVAGRRSLLCGAEAQRAQRRGRAPGAGRRGGRLRRAGRHDAMSRRRAFARSRWRVFARSRWRGRLARLGLAVLAASAGPVLCFRAVDPPTSAYIVQCRLGALLEGDWLRVERDWVDLEQVAPAAALAVVAAEDQKFPRHRGFDLEAIQDALEDGRDGGRVRGASTLSQQVAKNLFLWQGRSWLRKGLEAWFTVWIELLWPKRRILEVYLNLAELGPGVFGVEAASARFFGKPAAELQPREAALLAAVLPNPQRYRVASPSPWVRQRAERILAQMNRLGPGYLAPLLRR